MKAFCQRSSCNRRKSLSTLLVFALCLVFSTPLRGALVVATSEVYKDTVKDLGPVVRHRYEATDDNAGSPHIHHRLFVGGKLREYSSYAECGANLQSSMDNRLSRGKDLHEVQSFLLLVQGHSRTCSPSRWPRLRYVHH